MKYTKKKVNKRQDWRLNRDILGKGRKNFPCGRRCCINSVQLREFYLCYKCYNKWQIVNLISSINMRPNRDRLTRPSFRHWEQQITPCKSHKHFPPIINGQYFVRISVAMAVKLLKWLVDEDVFGLDRTMSANVLASSLTQWLLMSEHPTGNQRCGKLNRLMSNHH